MFYDSVNGVYEFYTVIYIITITFLYKIANTKRTVDYNVVSIASRATSLEFWSNFQTKIYWLSKTIISWNFVYIGMSTYLVYCMEYTTADYSACTQINYKLFVFLK